MKKVKVTVTGMPITSVSAPLTMGTHGPMMMEIKNIFKCIVSGAKVVEVLENGVELPLTLANYDSDNSVPKPVAPVEEVQVEPVDEVNVVESVEVQENISADVVEEPAVVDEAAMEAITDVIPAHLQKIEAAITEEKSESPEHWLPPQRENTVQRNNGKNNRNGKKGK